MLLHKGVQCCARSLYLIEAAAKRAPQRLDLGPQLRCVGASLLANPVSLITRRSQQPLHLSLCFGAHPVRDALGRLQNTDSARR